MGDCRSFMSNFCEIDVWTKNTKQTQLCYLDQYMQLIHENCCQIYCAIPFEIEKSVCSGQRVNLKPELIFPSLCTGNYNFQTCILLFVRLFFVHG